MPVPYYVRKCVEPTREAVSGLNNLDLHLIMSVAVVETPTVEWHAEWSVVAN